MDKRTADNLLAFIRATERPKPCQSSFTKTNCPIGSGQADAVAVASYQRKNYMPLPTETCTATSRVETET
jgi:hypothetical protein